MAGETTRHDLTDPNDDDQRDNSILGPDFSAIPNYFAWTTGEDLRERKDRLEDIGNDGGRATTRTRFPDDFPLETW